MIKASELYNNIMKTFDDKIDDLCCGNLEAQQEVARLKLEIESLWEAMLEVEDEKSQ